MTPRFRPAELAPAVLLLPYALLVHRYWFVCDDAFISFRYARHWAAGHGPRYNLGEHTPVEGYSNFLWMALSAVVEFLGLDVTVVIPLASIATGVVLLGLVYRTLRVHVEARPMVAFTSTLLLACFPPFVVWSTSGLETMPQALLMFATWLLLAVEKHERAPLAAGFTALALALVRTEGVAWAVVIGVLALVHRRLQGRDVAGALLPYLAPLVLGYATYFTWRYGYYDALFANTAYAKVHMEAATLERGIDYVVLYVAALVSPALLLASIPLGLGSSRREIALTTGLMALGVPAYAAVVSGDYMTWFRILVPGAAFMAVSFGVALHHLDQRAADAPWKAPLLAVAVAVLGALPMADVHIAPQSLREALTVRDKLNVFRTENKQWEAMVRHSENWAIKGQALNDFVGPGATYVAAAIGNVGYYADVFIYDRNGLVTREVAMQPWNGELRSPGHDKTVEYDFFLDQGIRPDVLDSKVVDGPRIATKMREAVREMRALRVRDRYYPVVVELPKLPGMRARRVFMPLVRADNPTDASQGWERYRDEVERYERGT